MSSSESGSDEVGADVDKIVAMTKNCEFFKRLVEEQQSEEIHRLCCEVMEICEVFDGQQIIRYGDIGSSFFIILKGKVGVYLPRVQRGSLTVHEIVKNRESGRRVSVFKYTAVDPKQLMRKNTIMLNPVLDLENFEMVKEMGPGESFGEMALINNRPRAATVTALCRSTLARLGEKSFRRLVEKFTEKRIGEKIRFMQMHPMFQKCTKLALMKISFYFNIRRATKGQILFKSGDETDGLYFIKSGEFMITKGIEVSRPTHYPTIMQRKTTIKSVNLIVKSSNEFIGLQEVIDEQEKRLTSCICLKENSEIYYISKEDLKSRINIPDAWNWLRNRYEWEKDYMTQRTAELTQVEKAKMSLGSRSLSELGFKYSDRYNVPVAKSERMVENLMKHRRVASMKYVY